MCSVGLQFLFRFCELFKHHHCLYRIHCDLITRSTLQACFFNDITVLLKHINGGGGNTNISFQVR